jgi:TM2 domain-containing membrane protein YozV
VLQGALEERRSVALSYGLWCLSLVGLCGIHRLYNRKPLSGLLWLFTFGLCGLGQFVDLLLIPGLVAGANRQGAPSPTQASPHPPVDRQLLRLARDVGERGFTINDALLDLDLPPQMDSQALNQEIDKLLVANLLDVGNDERGRVVYREP